MSNKKLKPTTAFRNELKGADAYTRHKHLIKNYLLFYGDKPKPYVPDNYKTERDIIHKNHKFVRSELDQNSSWEQRVAKKYYDKLFKEYAICELKYYKEGRIALRWRTEKEVMAGKGQFICASTRCESSENLKSWEINFGYMEDDEKKNELVKVRLCEDCSDKLNYKTKKRLAQNLKRKRKEEKKTRRHKTSREVDSDGSASGDFSCSSGEDEEQEEDVESEKAESSIWSKPLENNEEKSKEEEYEDYFADLLQ